MLYQNGTQGIFAGGMMKLFRTKSAALPSADEKSPMPESGQSAVVGQFSDEILRTTTGLLEIVKLLLKITDKNPDSESLLRVSMDLLELRQSLLKTCPKDINLGEWETVFSDQWSLDQSTSSSTSTVDRHQNVNGASYTFDPEIGAYFNRNKQEPYLRQFTDMNAFTIVAVSEFKRDLDGLITEILKSSLFLQEIIITLLDQLLIYVLEVNERENINAELNPELTSISRWWETSKFKTLKEEFYKREKLSDSDFIQKVISEGSLTKLCPNLLMLLQQSQRRLAAIVQLHPNNSDLAIHCYHHNASCLYEMLEKLFGKMNTLISGSDNNKAVVSKCGFKYICENVIRRFKANTSQHIVRTREVPVSTRNRAKSVDHEQVILPPNSTEQRKSAVLPSFSTGSKSLRSPRTRLLSKSTAQSPENGSPGSKRRSNSASIEFNTESESTLTSSRLGRHFTQESVILGQAYSKPDVPLPIRASNPNWEQLRAAAEKLQREIAIDNSADRDSGSEKPNP